MMKAFKKIDWPLVYIFVIFGALFLWMGKSLLFGADGDTLIAGVNRGKVIGQIYPIALKSSETITGASKFGGWISGASIASRSSTSGVTATMESSTGQGESVVFYIADDTSVTGNTVYVVAPTGDQIVCESTVTAGVSAIQLSGTTMSQVVTFVGTGVSTWAVFTETAPTLRGQ